MDLIVFSSSSFKCSLNNEIVLRLERFWLLDRLVMFLLRRVEITLNFQMFRLLVRASMASTREDKNP
jgi:hypothetical protein